MAPGRMIESHQRAALPGGAGKLRWCLTAGVLVTLLMACGSSDFSGTSAKAPVPPTADPEVPHDDPATKAPAALSSLTWYWQCDSDKAKPPAAASGKDPVLVGAGPFSIPQQMVQGMPVTFAGHMCKPATMKRDIVFIIDVSGSMFFNDPRVGAGCGRLNAIQTVIQSSAGGAAKLGLVTFGSGVKKVSTGLFDTQDKLFADAAASGTIADTVCAATDETNYQGSLQAANNLLQTGRADATKEIYFISDGEPTKGYDGIAEATALKSTGIQVAGKAVPVTIATVMLNGSDQVLEKSIASKDASGKPLHAYVKNAADLAQALSKLANNGITSATLKYRPVGGDQWTNVDLMPYVKGYDFSVPSINMTKDQAPDGIEVVVQYADQQGNSYSSSGKLTWADSGSDGSSAIDTTPTATPGSWVPPKAPVAPAVVAPVTATPTATSTATATKATTATASGSASATATGASTGTAVGKASASGGKS